MVIAAQRNIHDGLSIQPTDQVGETRSECTISGQKQNALAVEGAGLRRKARLVNAVCISRWDDFLANDHQAVL